MFLQQYAVNLFLDDYCLLGCEPCTLAKTQMFQSNLLLPSSEFKNLLYQRMRQQVPLKLQNLPIWLNIVTSKKTVILKFRAVRTSTVHPLCFFSANYKYLLHPHQWNNEFLQLLVGRDKVSCYYSLYTFQHSVWAGIVGEGLATKTNRKWLMLLQRKRSA
jgi:hypothetical protein